MIDRLRLYVQGFTRYLGGALSLGTLFRNLVEIINSWSYVWVDCWFDFIFITRCIFPESGGIHSSYIISHRNRMDDVNHSCALNFSRLLRINRISRREQILY